jgi:hypothetical protein
VSPLYHIQSHFIEISSRIPNSCISKTIKLLCGSVVLWRLIATDTLRLRHSTTVARLSNLLGYCGSVALWFIFIFISCLGQAQIKQNHFCIQNGREGYLYYS